MLICIEKKSGKLIEAQSDATVGTLIKNAINAGYTVDQIEEKSVSSSDFATLLRTPEVIAREQEVVAKFQAFNDNLPSWAEVETAIDGVTTIAGLKVVVKKLARVVYWLAKNSLT